MPGTRCEHPTGEALAAAVQELRSRLKKPTAPIAVIAPSTVNGTLARQSFAAASPFIRVSFLTPVQLHGALARPGLRAKGLQPAPPGWERATLSHLLRVSELGSYGTVMRNPGWLPALTSAIGALESAGVTAETLKSVELAGDLAERARVLAVLMEGLAWARAEDGIFSPADEAEAAQRAIAEDAPIPANEPTGVVVLGDANNPRHVASSLAAWLREREVVRVGLAPMDVLPAARGGARSAQPEMGVVAAAPPAPEVRMVRTPDPVRQQVEIVRRVLAAVRDGVPFDRLAIVLPDPGEAVALREALERANVPATWMTGPPLASAPAARFLLHALRIALGDDGVASWYELLARPGLRLRKALGAGATTGRGRWRRLLADCGAYRGTKTIVRALDGTLEELAERELEPEAMSAERAAIESLRACIEYFHGDFDGWVAPRTLGAWARTWLAFVERHWRRGADTRAVVRLLEGWSRADAGPEQPLSETLTTLEDALATTEQTSGSLRDPSVRVLSPMQCLGADFELICVASMTQGRFPRNPSEDPILSDALIDAIEAATGAGLFRSDDRVALERRRFAAVRSAARGELWVSCPGVDMLKGRPLLPGSLLLELAEEVHGRRLAFAELEAELEIAGRRSRAYPESDTSALDAAEHLLVRLKEGGVDERRAALAALADHATGARLLRAYRAADLIRAGLRHPGLRPHAGFVSVEVTECRGLDGEALSPSALDLLLHDPAAFFLRRVLGAWPAKRLREDFDPVAHWYVGRVLREQATLLLHESTAKLAKELMPRFEATVAGDMDRAGVADETTTKRVERMGRRLASLLLGAEPNAGPPLELADAPLDPELPWRVEGASARRVGASLEWLVDSAPTPKNQREGFGVLAELAAAVAAGQRVDDVRWVGVDGSERAPKDGLDPLLDGFRERLSLVTEMVRDGAYPGEGPSKLRIDAAVAGPVDDEWWSSWQR